MKTIPIRTRANSLAVILKKARRQALFLRTDDAEYLLDYVDEFDREVAGTRANKAFMAYLDRCRRETKTYSHEEVCRMFGLTPMDPKKAERQAIKIIENEGPKVIDLGHPQRLVAEALEKAKSEDVLLRTAAGAEYFLGRVSRGNREAALRRRSLKVGRHLDRLVKRREIPVVEVIFSGAPTAANGRRNGPMPASRPRKVKRTALQKT